MNRRTAVAFATVLVGSGLVLGASAFAQQKSLSDQLVGSWIFVSFNDQGRGWKSPVGHQSEGHRDLH